MTLLLYADDLVISAERRRDPQQALDAIGAWRFSFGIGPAKTAVLVVGSRSHDHHFTLQGHSATRMSEYCYLGVIFQSSRKWSKHCDRLVERCTGKFHQSVSWAENRQLHTVFRRSLFQSYGLPSMLYGSHFLDQSSLKKLDQKLDQKLRQFGRRLPLWPSGAAGAAVLGELGWHPFLVEVQRVQFALFGRLSVASAHGVHRSLAARVFQFEATQRDFLGVSSCQ